MKIAFRTGIFLLWLTSISAWADTLVATADRTRISINETLNLTLSYDEQVDSRQIDLSALQQDFEILNNSTSSQVSIINGRQDVSTTWNLVLLPRRVGAAIIPSFQISGNFSEAISIQVSEAAEAGARSQPISVELLVSKESVAVMEQLLVTIRLIASSQVSNLSGDSLSIEGAETTLLNQSQYSEVANGATWQINEWTYAVFANEASTLEIPGQLFSGIIGSTTRSIFDSFGSRGQRTLARSPAASVQVTAAPSGQYWFPASEVRIEEDWPDASASNDYRVGEPITRNISIVAFGQKPETIPPLPEMEDDSFKIYADQPELISQTTEEHLVGVRSESAAIVPTRAGELTLPEIRIPWWDVEDSTWKEAVLEARKINILEAESSASLAPPEDFSVAEIETTPTQTEDLSYSSIWIWSTAIFALLSLILALLLVRRPRLEAVTESHEPSSSGEQKAWSALTRKLKSGSAKEKRSAIEHWCREAWPDSPKPPIQLLASMLSAEAAAELSELEKSIYGASGTEAPQQDQLMSELKRLRKNRDAKSDAGSALPPLNPI